LLDFVQTISAGIGTEMADDPKQAPGEISGLGPATKPGVPEGNSTTQTSTPPSAKRYGIEYVERSTPVGTVDQLARKAGRR
jgi:hypothetical protein